MCMFASLRTYLRASIFVTVCVYLRVYMRVRVSAWLRACECVRMCKCVCLSVRAYACTCAFIGAFVDVCANQTCACGCAAHIGPTRACARVPACAYTCIICVNACYATFYHILYNMSLQISNIH